MTASLKFLLPLILLMDLGTPVIDVVFQGRVRQYLLHVPETPGGALVLVFHRGMAEVASYEIEGGGHRWPPHVIAGPAEAASRQENGMSSQNLDATKVIWAFFAAHARR